MSHLPYHDSKPQGAADFYFAIHATFRFLLEAQGKPGWIAYLQDLGKDYYRSVNERWKDGGLSEVAAYWREFFRAEPGAEVEVETTGDTTRVLVRQCPAVAHLRDHGREILPCFCQHCYYLNQARAAEAGLSMTVDGGNGSCVHSYHSDPDVSQDLQRIREVE